MHKQPHILVVGDIMLDDYIFAEIKRMSPESPRTPVILTKHRRQVLGGAANVANNVAQLGAKVTLAGVIGRGSQGNIVHKLMEQAGIRSALVESNRPTTTKTRVFEHQTQITRIDSETSDPLPQALRNRLIQKIKSVGRIDMVVISDYAKGVLSKELVTFLVKQFGREKIVADFKPAHQRLIRDIHAITPNSKEAGEMAGHTIRTLRDAEKCAAVLAKKLRTTIVLTMGHKGVLLCTAAGNIERVPAKKVKALDVTGAGDTLTAALAVGLARGHSISAAARFANTLAAIAVSKLGTATVSAKEVQRLLRA